MTKIAHRIQGTHVAASLSASVENERQVARTALCSMVTSLHYFCKQGLAIRGHTDATGCYENLLNLRADDLAELKSWLARSGYKWKSPFVQSELIEDVAMLLLRSYKQDIIDAK